MAVKKFYVYLNDGTPNPQYFGVASFYIPTTAKTLAEVQAAVPWASSGAYTSWTDLRLQTAFDYMNLYQMVPIIPENVTYTQGGVDYTADPRNSDTYTILSGTTQSLRLATCPALSGATYGVSYRFCVEFGVTTKNYFTISFPYNTLFAPCIGIINIEGVNTGYTSSGEYFMAGATAGINGSNTYGRYPLTCITSDNHIFSISFSGFYNTNVGHSSFSEEKTNVFLSFMEMASDLPVDPYAPGGTSGPGGGDGTFDWESDEIPIAPLPPIGAMNSGFINLYMPTLAELQNLARYMWAGAFDINSLKKIVADPMDIILGLSILPITQDEAEATDGSILIGNLDSQISCKVAQKQFVQIDCGIVDILPKWGAYLDYSPHSKLQLYLPYIGFVDISPDDCMNGKIWVVYNIDILSGACLAQVFCVSPAKAVDETYDHVLYEFTGNCATECPVTSGQYRNILSSLFNIASGVTQAAATKNPISAIDATVESVVDTLKPQVSRSGGPGKNTGMLGHQAPFLVLTCPRMIIPGDQNKMIGYPSYVTLNLGDLTGFTQVDTIHLSGVPASDNEQNEIIQLLHEGVYL